MPSRASSKMGMEEAEGDRKVEQVLCMNGGDGETSYSKNSNLQRNVMASVRHVVEESMTEVWKTFSSKGDLISIADLGCATGPNALFAMLEIVKIIGKFCEKTENHQKKPSIFALLNDLLSNDFNNIFRSLGNFYDALPRNRGFDQCFVAAVPGSFYGRLFPSKSLNFVHSSYSLMWLSQVPDGLVGENGEALNKGNICICEASSLAVRKAFGEQFKRDFNVFLKSRSEEVILGGSMVLTFLGNVGRIAPFKVYEVIGQTLAQMANEGLVNKSKLDIFNLPLHTPSADQISEVILDQNLFNLRKIEVIKTPWDAGMDEEEGIGEIKTRNARGGEFVAKYLRAVVEPLLVAAEFGDRAVMDELFGRAALKFGELMGAGDCHYLSIVVWLTRV
uniref:Uncharacterized protein n=1 Tax=Kalanchoe fedtschenkoi TaxID=63787 RepID=A0A7N0ZR22_KALFE